MGRLEPLPPRCGARGRACDGRQKQRRNPGALQANRSRDLSPSARLRRLQVAAGVVCTLASVGPHSARQCLSTGIRLALLESLYNCCYSGNFAPSPTQSDGEAANPGPRFRKRGPRSALAKERRAANVRRVLKRAEDVALDGSDGWSDAKFRILHVNIRGWTSHAAELTARIRLMGQKPDLICVNETFLNRTTEHISIEGYSLIARRDRSDGRKCGGIAAFAASNISQRVTLVESSENAERVWLLVHANQGPHLVGVWYRPPNPGEVATIDTFKTELDALEGLSLGTIVLGDLNVHNKRWLRHSSANTTEGAALKQACDEAGLTQKVRKPTRNEHLLDLVLTNIPGTTTKVAPGIADHKLVTAELVFKVPEQVTLTRMVWQFANADWDLMREMLRTAPWENMKAMGASDAADFFNKTIQESASHCIPQRELRERKSTHPWLNADTELLVKAKNDAEGTPGEREAAEKCSAGILAGFLDYTRKCADRLRDFLPSSKGWWAKTRQLLDAKPKTSNIPALKSDSGSWVFEPTAKANLFAEKFAAKYSLITEEQNVYSYISQNTPVQLKEPVPTEEVAAKILRGLQEDSATGPDMLPTRMLRECADVLAGPFRILALLILEQGSWPQAWMKHWIVPLFKKGAVFKPGNYRGIHLTPQVSKAMERFLGSMVVTFMSLPAIAGPNQFAYQKARGARDALAYMVLSWLSGFNRRLKFGVYCSDVSGAFDRVSARRLLDKLRAKGLREDMLKVFEAWLAERQAVVVCGGQHGDPICLNNMIYQGTVWGPWLWNIFYEDARMALRVHQFLEIVFADDLNAFRPFPLATPNEQVMAANKACQVELHSWGKANQVEFDPKKESMHVVSHYSPEGPNFNILGLNFDCRLIMCDAIVDLVTEMRWRVRSILRAQRYNTVTGMMNLYKAKVLSYAEYRTAAIYHSSVSSLEAVDQVQRSFLKDIGVDELSAFMSFNLAPLSLRRDIAMLGLIHRTVLGLGPQHFQRFFFAESCSDRRTKRCKRHHRQLHEYRQGQYLDMVGRSALGLTSVYNLLPREIVEVNEVKIFQRLLQDLARDCASRNVPDWQHMLSTRHRLHVHPLKRL